MITAIDYTLNTAETNDNVIFINESSNVNICGLECTGEDIMNAFIDSVILKEELDELRNQINGEDVIE